jgi:hypothetical protein
MPNSVPSFVDALRSGSPSPDRKDGLNLYAWLVGRRQLDAALRKADGWTAQTRGFVSAGWVLEGRAIQDVFSLPGVFYGSTLRVYDPEIDGWHCH